MKYTAAHWGTYSFDPKAEPPQLTPFAADPDPSEIGQGWVSATKDTNMRIARPAIRKGWLEGDAGANRCDDAFVEVDWDTALTHAANTLRDTAETHGHNAIFAGSYGWASAGRFHHAQSHLRRFMNQFGGYVASRNTYSHAAAEILFPYILGHTNKQFEEALTTWPLIAEHCTLMLAFGGISRRTGQIASGGTSEHDVHPWMQRAGEAGMETLCISPLAWDIDTHSGANWLPIRAGADTALIMALTYELLANGWADTAFLARYTDGWETYAAYLTGDTDGTPKSPDWAAPLCDIPSETIRALAARLPKERVMVSLSWGMQRGDHGEQPLWAGLALAAALGQIGQPGTGYGFGYGCTNMSGRPQRFVTWPSMPQGTARKLDEIPVARIADMLLNPGAPYTYDSENRTYPDIRLIHWVGGNPFHHHQDLHRLEAAWRRPETVIVQDHTWTATARRADIVLPATAPLERDDLMLNRRDKRLIAMSKMLEPHGDALDDYMIFTGLAERLGFAETFTEGRSASDWMAHMWRACEAVAQAENLTLPDYESFRATGITQPDPKPVNRIALADFIADPKAAPLATESGRIQITSPRIAALNLPDCAGHPMWFEPAEWTYGVGEDVFHLISNQPRTRLHAQLDGGDLSRSEKVEGREACTLHPDAAARIGVSDGDIVLLRNARGACLAGVRLRSDMRADCVVLPTGATLDLQETAAGRICVHGNPNVLTIDKGTSGLGQGNIAHTATVSISRWDAALPPVKALKPPRFDKKIG